MSRLISKFSQNMSSAADGDAKVIVAMDFGTTFSGFAYAHTSEIGKVFTNYDWPSQSAAGAKPYCKTLTGLWYMPGFARGSYDLKHWGWPAFVNYLKALQAQNTPRIPGASSKDNSRTSLISMLDAFGFGGSVVPECGYFVKKFKLDLAPSDAGVVSELPDGITAERAISDYLQELAKFVIIELRNRFGNHLSEKDIQWCITVPAIWDDPAKQKMKDCAEVAGLVEGPLSRRRGGSNHPVVIVLEPEAASVYCQSKLTTGVLSAGSKFLVADVGGGTVDLVLQEKVDETTHRVKEVSRSSGGLCGGTYVDQGFFDFLARKIECVRDFGSKFPATLLSVKSWWEGAKCNYDGSSESFTLELPARLAAAWEADVVAKGLAHDDVCFDVLEISAKEMKSIFDPVVDEILQLIEARLVPRLQAIMVVGGFSASPYLMMRIREKFSRRVEHIISPPDPGSAVCCGAVAFGASVDIVMTRISRKTYGIGISDEFRPGYHKTEYRFVSSHGVVRCSNVILIFARKEEEIPVNHCATHIVVPIEPNQVAVNISLYSSDQENPTYTTDPGVQQEGSFSVPIPSEAWLRNLPSIEVRMHFGRSLIEVSASGQNFGNKEKHYLTPVPFDRSFK